jgi:DNA-binding GntR family transcriptional regulator
VWANERSAMSTAPERALRKTTYAALTDLLREEVVSGRIPAGSRLTVAEVASRYGVSDMPVREALQCLQGEGLVGLLPHKGARVLPLDAQRVENIYDLRGAVESLLARLSLPNLTNAAMARLDALYRQFVASAEAGDLQSVLALNAEFHSVLYRHANNPVALDIYDRYAGLMRALRQRYGVGPGRMAERVAGLGEVLDALRAQDAERLGKVVEHQCELAKRDLLSLMREECEAEMPHSADPTTMRLLNNGARR